MIESFYFFIHPLNRFYKIHSLKSVTLVTAVASMGFQDFQGFMDQLAQVQPLALCIVHQMSQILVLSDIQSKGWQDLAIVRNLGSRLTPERGPIVFHSCHAQNVEHSAF